MQLSTTLLPVNSLLCPVYAAVVPAWCPVCACTAMLWRACCVLLACACLPVCVVSCCACATDQTVCLCPLDCLPGGGSPLFGVDGGILYLILTRLTKTQGLKLPFLLKSQTQF